MLLSVSKLIDRSCGNDLALTFNFAETGRYSIVLTLSDINDQRGVDTVVVNVGEGEPPITTSDPPTTSSETSTSEKKDSGDDGFLPINLYVILIAFPVLVYLRRRK